MRESWHVKRITEPETNWKEEQLNPHPTFRSRSCLEISGPKRSEIEVDVAVEEVVNIILNGSCITAIPALPDQLKEMAVGFLVGEGIVESFQDIVSVKEEKGALICETRDGKAAPWKGHQCCSVGSSSIQDLKPITSETRIKVDALLGAVDQLNERAKIWRRTGATHTSIICDSDGIILASCEDVSRSSSVDKTVGAALLAGTNLSKCALITSGRLSGVMVAKAARSGFPILVSRSAPMNSGVELAGKIGMTLVAFARSPNLYVYVGAERLI
ncbi:MAG: formate dehydrogenase accessory sulfurtransferase FdhD [Methanotrichaceae archaeon]